DTQLIAANLEANRERSLEVRKIFDDRVRREGVSSRWQAVENLSGDSAIGALSVARACDLVVAQQSDPEGGTLANLEALLFETGRPVLFVPYAVAVSPAFRKVLIAWNGSQQAARAVFDALPFIREAESVEILSVDAADTSQQD